MREFRKSSNMPRWHWLVAQFHSKQLSTEMSLNSLLNHFSKTNKSLKINAASYRFSFEFLRQLRTHSQSPKLMMKMFWCWKVSFYHYCVGCCVCGYFCCSPNWWHYTFTKVLALCVLFNAVNFLRYTFRYIKVFKGSKSSLDFPRVP